MPEPGPARRRRCGRRMAGLAWKWPRTRLPVGASALGVFVLCWLYVFPVYRLPDEKEIVQGVLLQQGKAWRRNQTAGALFRKLLEECCDPGQLFAMTKLNSPMGKNLWFDGEFLYSFTIDNATYSLFPQATPFQLPLKKCSVVGNGGILKKSGCGKQIDQADFVMRCNLPPLSSEYSRDVGSKTQLVTANPSIIQKRALLCSGQKWLFWNLKAPGAHRLFEKGCRCEYGPSARWDMMLLNLKRWRTLFVGLEQDVEAALADSQPLAHQNLKRPTNHQKPGLISPATK